MKKLSTAKIWQFAAGQFGWAMLSGIISNWLVYFYQPDQVAISQGQTVFIPQGLVVFGIFTIIGGITAFGRIFDAFTDPMIASLSDRCTSKHGRRIPFLKWASLPLALSTVLVFWSPVNNNSRINAVFLLVMILAYYLSITAYCTPYNALIPELGHTQQERLNISTVISFTFIAGTAVAYLAPTIWGMFIPAFGRVGAIRVTFTIMAVIAFICMLVPVFCICLLYTSPSPRHTGYEADTEDRKEQDDSVCICGIQSGLFLYRFYGKNFFGTGKRTGTDSYGCSSAADGNFRNSPAGSRCRYRTE